jgi:DUF917 family protein
MTTIRNDQEIDDLVRGATFLGTGGGGSPEEGGRLLRRELAEGHKIGWVDKGSVLDDEWTACVSFMGNRAPLTAEERRKRKDLGLDEWKFENNLVEAVRGLQEYLGVRVHVIVSPELGGSNTPGPLATGARLGIPVVDGDYAGRALPEIAQMTPCVLGKPILPIVSVDKWGNSTIIKEAVNYELAERIGKMLAMAAFGNTGLAFPLKGSVMKEVIIPGTLSQCYNIGKAMREIRNESKHPVDDIVDLCKGWLLFVGKVMGKEWEVMDGYYCGAHLIEGTNRFQGHQFKIWFKNENHVTWLDDQIHVTSPDLIIQIDPGTCEPIPNHELQEGQPIAIIGMKSRELYRTPRGIDLVGPKRYGFHLDYVPIEERLSPKTPKGD